MWTGVLQAHSPRTSQPARRPAGQRGRSAPAAVTALAVEMGAVDGGRTLTAPARVDPLGACRPPLLSPPCTGSRARRRRDHRGSEQSRFYAREAEADVCPVAARPASLLSDGPRSGRTRLQSEGQ